MTFPEICQWTAVAVNVYCVIVNMRWARRHYEAHRRYLRMQAELMQKMWGKE